MTKRDCTQLFIQYREIARVVWNLGFWPNPALREWDAVELYQDLLSGLFEGMVLVPLGYRGRSEEVAHPGKIMNFRVEIASPNARLLVDKHSPEEPGRIWGHPILTLLPGRQELRFIAFFDWDQRAPREMRFLEVVIEHIDERPDLVGRHALIEFDQCSIWLVLDGEKAPSTKQQV
jgi:hypothetical protein